MDGVHGWSDGKRDVEWVSQSGRGAVVDSGPLPVAASGRGRPEPPKLRTQAAPCAGRAEQRDVANEKLHSGLAKRDGLYGGRLRTTACARRPAPHDGLCATARLVQRGSGRGLSAGVAGCAAT